MTTPNETAERANPSGAAPTKARIPASVPFLLALWLALAASTFELAVRFAIWQLTPRPLSAGVDLVWMAPLMNLVWLGLAATAAWIGMRLWPHRIRLGVVVGLLTFPAVLSALWLHPKFHRDAMVLLALGIAVQAGRLAASRLEAVRCLNRRALAITVPLAVLPIILLLGQARWREWRAMRALPAAAAGAPSILLLVLDTVRSFSLSAYGYGEPTTPVLERLSREGVRFDRAFATSSWTLPSHSSMFTGRYADELETGPGQPLPPGPPTLAEALTDAGYATGGFTANLKYTTREHGVARGFVHYEDHPATPLTIFASTALGRKLIGASKVRHLTGFMDDVDRKSAERVQDDFLAWLDGLGDRPFFAFLNFYDAHHPYLPPAPYDTMFGPALAPAYRPYPPVFREFDSAEVRQAANGYHGAIAYADAQIGQLLDALQRRGRLENTLVIITSDHGEHLGDHSLMSHGNSFYRQLLQVPLLVRHPARVPAGVVVRTPVSLRDLPRFVLDFAGVDAGDAIPGVSLATLIADSTAQGSPVLSGRTLVRSTEAQSVIDAAFHYIRHADGREELYDLERDSLELVSLSDSAAYAEVLATMRDRLDSLNRAVPPAGP